MNLHKNNARSDIQLERMNLAENLKLCPFCSKGLIQIHKAPIEKETEAFFVTKNVFPYEGTRVHLLIIPKEHISTIADIAPKHWIEIGELFQWIVKKENLDAGALFVRFGNMHKTGSSIEHLHFQIISGTKTDEEDSEGLKVKLGYK
ncbi:hypothetical protein COB18_03155 [Candidatus Kaiserbacteria bacterium]|nr:MAG: hypothetical protein COB18_03155 [Candidatus Kaiserbacteria bacterium]